MEEPHSILPTLEHLLEYLLDLEQKVRAVRKLWSASLEVNQPWLSYLKEQPRRNTHQLKQEVAALDLLIADCKITMLEFLPTCFQPISVKVREHLYFISKNVGVKGKAPFLNIRQQD